MNTFIQQHASFFSQLREFLVFFYAIAVIILFVAAMIEVKLYFHLDIIPGADLPLDELYAKYLK